MKYVVEVVPSRDDPVYDLCTACELNVRVDEFSNDVLSDVVINIPDMVSELFCHITEHGAQHYRVNFVFDGVPVDEFSFWNVALPLGDNFRGALLYLEKIIEFYSNKMNFTTVNSTPYRFFGQDCYDAVIRHIKVHGDIFLSDSERESAVSVLSKLFYLIDSNEVLVGYRTCEEFLSLSDPNNESYIRAVCTYTALWDSYKPILLWEWLVIDKPNGMLKRLIDFIIGMNDSSYLASELKYEYTTYYYLCVSLYGDREEDIQSVMDYVEARIGRKLKVPEHYDFRGKAMRLASICEGIYIARGLSIDTGFHCFKTRG